MMIIPSKKNVNARLLHITKNNSINVKEIRRWYITVDMLASNIVRAMTKQTVLYLQVNEFPYIILVRHPTEVKLNVLLKDTCVRT